MKVCDVDLKSPVGANCKFATGEELVAHCYRLASYYLKRLETWRPYISELTNTDVDADADAFWRKCFLTIGPITSGLKNVDAFAKRPTLDLVDRVTSPLLEFLNEFRGYLWSALESGYLKGVEKDPEFLLLSTIGKEFAMATQDIVLTSWSINVLQNVRESIFSNDLTSRNLS